MKTGSSKDQGSQADLDKYDDQKTTDGTGDQGAGDQTKQQDADDDVSPVWSDPKKAEAEIKRLRAEAAKNRVKGKSLEDELTRVKGTLGKLKAALGMKDDESEPPEKQVESLKARNEALELEVGLVNLVRDAGVPRESESYFRFLLAQKFESLEEGEELSEEDIQECANEAKARARNKGGSTGVDDKGAPPADGGSDLTVAQFAKMNLGEKSQLYVKNPALYQRLFQEAVEKKLL